MICPASKEKKGDEIILKMPSQDVNRFQSGLMKSELKYVFIVPASRINIIDKRREFLKHNFIKCRHILKETDELRIEILGDTTCFE